MQKIILIISVFFLIFLDQGSKYLIESLSVRDYCVFNERYEWNASNEIIGGLSPEFFCSPDYPSNKLAYYETHRELPLFHDFLRIQLSYNRGIAFSLPIHGLPLQFLTILLVIGILFYYIRYEYPKKNTWIDGGFALILAGALSHAYERIFVGHVVDFIAVKYFAILNFADIFISVGAVILLLMSFLHHRS